ncbi:SRPBCC family protein [Terrabacter sp. AAH1]
MRFDVETKATPEQVLRAFTDFSERRPQIWSTLDPKAYEVRGLGDTWAVARESSPGSPFWVVSRYDWSDPSVVRWTVEESSYGGGGSGTLTIEPRPTGGSRAHAWWESTGARPLQKPMLFVLHHGPLGRLVFARLWAAAFDRYADGEHAAARE